MITTVTVEDAPVLIPNQAHKNYTAGKDVIKKDTQVVGDPIVVVGLRRGEPFTYRLFKTNDNKLIYLNKIKQMEPIREVQIGADATKINLKQNILMRPEVLAAISGAIIGFGIAKYKKHDMKKAGIYALVGAVSGFVIGKVAQHTGIVKINK